MPRRLITSIVLIAFAAAGCGSSGTTTEPRLQTVDAERFAQVIEAGGADLVIVDLRTPEEFAEVHIPGAINIDYYDAAFESELDALAKETSYAVYCRSGNRSADTMAMMRALAFTDVTELAGGIITWYEAGFPLDF
jgi:rhodanese-related sulfurtransferase